MPRKTAVRLHLDDDLLEWLRAEAARLRSSVSAVMRALVLAAMQAKK